MSQSSSYFKIPRELVGPEPKENKWREFRVQGKLYIFNARD